MIAALASTIRRLTALPLDNPELLKAQYFVLLRQMPLFYFVLVVNTWALATSYLSSAPLWRTVGLCSLFTVVAILRSIRWWRVRNWGPDTAQIIHVLIVSSRIAVVMCASLAWWAFSLYPYGDSYAQVHVAFFMAVTVFATIFCMIHLRPVAWFCTAILNTSLVLFFITDDNLVLIAITVNIVLVSTAVFVVMQNHYRDFSNLADVQVKTAKMSDENIRLGNEDSLTGLANRRQFFLSLQGDLQNAKRDNRRLAVGIIDLDGFKLVNDVYGHSVGDRLLVQVGQRLAKLSNSHIQVARLGGDEFAVIFAGGEEDVALDALGMRLCAELRAPYLVGDLPIKISASLGVATYPDMASSADQLYEFADYALYQSKRGNVGSICLFSPQLYKQLHHNAVAARSGR